jgi:predicted dehydrogenase
VKVGIIGCGGITAFAHLPALLRRRDDGVQVSYLCDSNIHRTEVLRRRYGLTARSTVDFREVLDDPETDALIVASTPVTHDLLAASAIATGKHVLLQKPLALTNLGIQEVLTAASRSNANVLALPLVSNIPGLAQIRDLLRSNTFGQIRSFRIRTSISGPKDYFEDVQMFFEEKTPELPYLTDSYARKAGAIADMGPYALTVFHFLFGPGDLVWATADASTYERAAILMLSTKQYGVTGTVELGWEQVPIGETCMIVGSAASGWVEPNGALTVVGDEGAHLRTHDIARSAILPASPTDAQDEWVDAVLRGEAHAFHDSVETACWVAAIIAETYKRH